MLALFSYQYSKHLELPSSPFGSRSTNLEVWMPTGGKTWLNRAKQLPCSLSLKQLKGCLPPPKLSSWKQGLIHAENRCSYYHGSWSRNKSIQRAIPWSTSKSWKPKVTKKKARFTLWIPDWQPDCKALDLPLVLSRCGSSSLEGLSDVRIPCRLPHVCVQLGFSTPSSPNSIPGAVCPMFSSAGHKRQDFSLA